MDKKVTIKDIAREAGVSVATVSYVINNRTDMRISEQTRKKVLQIINLFGYTPNPSAQALVTDRRHLIALALTPGISVLHDAEQLYFMDCFSAWLQERGYNVIYLNSSIRSRFDRADVIVCYNLPSEDFLEMGDENFVPLLAMDCMLGERPWLFFQVNTDYRSLCDQACARLGTGFTLCMLSTPNLERRKLLNEIFPNIVFVRGQDDLDAFLNANGDKPLLVVDHTIAELLDKHPHMLYAPLITSAKFEMLQSAMERAIAREQADCHDLLVAPEL